MPGWRWIVPDLPGYVGSAPLPLGLTDQLSHARRLGHVLDALGLEEAILVAHSLSAGAALCLAATRPRRLSGLLLIAPFCRPTSQDWKPALRLVSAPGWGAPLRPMLPPLARLARRPILRRLMTPNAVPRLPRRGSPAAPRGADGGRRAAPRQPRHGRCRGAPAVRSAGDCAAGAGRPPSRGGLAPALDRGAGTPAADDSARRRGPCAPSRGTRRGARGAGRPGPPVAGSDGRACA
ncbi:alpha/beta fold hydrolase [Cereibacter sphaeroides]|uniref:alpha/beta fold hydrolase n=1 Tax=Cereibacter sphaeroides TaxID=1063 RepID=UPI003990CC5F